MRDGHLTSQFNVQSVLSVMPENNDLRYFSYKLSSADGGLWGRALD